MRSSATESMVLLNQFLDDNLPLTTLSCANAVNNYGEIVGFGYAGPRYGRFSRSPNDADEPTLRIAFRDQSRPVS